MHCLLIDDDIPTLNVLHDFIDWHLFGITEVMMAHNIHDAVLHFDSYVPDIIICDIEMPKGSGMDMIKWVRDHNHDSAFIFFTCHENFEFAKTAIQFKADAYIVKPFDKDKLETSLLKAVEAVRRRREQDTFSQYGQTWLKNRDLVEQSFWRDVLFATIVPRNDLIQAEMNKRGLDIDLNEHYALVLCSVDKADMEIVWNDATLKYALHNVSSEIMFGTTDHPRLVTYEVDNVFYAAFIITSDMAAETLGEKCRVLVDKCRRLFRCTATCYISKDVPAAQLAKAKSDLEELDKQNVIHKGKVHCSNQQFVHVSPESYTLHADQLNLWFVEGERVKIVNQLKKELEVLTAQNKLDLPTMRAIQQDFVQIAYSQLYKNNIQARHLFSDDVSQELFTNAEHSVFHFLKWATFVTNKTIDCLKEIVESESIVEKAKRFIHDHYNRDLSREDIAAVVYLTPDYLNKRFKSETGLSIKEYLIEYRIKMAQELLLQSQSSVSQIAAETGFDSVSYFSTVFKKVTGETPNAYRMKHKLGVHQTT
ncbi:helix-turn-helix domain-containing protein [Marinicrinis lubricantis]|uniref:Helix-turn-helix domain-containing protein n=1 Tax=Marinicrinis lubricantis TaxID=2086470 RepID=A0ABW1ILA2_9BACL